MTRSYHQRRTEPTDELLLKVKGNTKSLYALMDDETRFWIAQQVADSKSVQDVRPLFQKGRDVAGKKPDMLITDGAPNFTKHTKRSTGQRLHLGLPRTTYPLAKGSE